ncbi:MAG: efflux RND transporter permease subunit [bacterium]
MKIAEYSVKNYQFTIVVFLALIAIGVNTFINISRSEDPSFPNPTYAIIAIYPGASPVDLEQLVVDPLEEKINELEDLKRLRAEIEDGLMYMRVEFETYVDADKKYDEVLREINSIRGDLPADLLSLETVHFNTTNVNILQIALVSETAPYKDLEEQAEKLKKRLKTVSGVKEVEKLAYPEREVRVALDLGKLAQLRISLSQVIGMIQSSNANIPGGSVDVAGKKFNIKTSGNYKSLEEIRRTVVGAAAGQAVFLQDVAEVEWNYEDQTYAGRYNGKRAVFVTANQKAGQNVFNVRKNLGAEIDAFTQELPKNVSLNIGFDQAQNVASRLNSLYRDFMIAIVLVLVTLLPLGVRASFIVMISIPLSLLIGLSLLEAFGFNLNQLSIVGFVIALGLLVDDSIVVAENITRFLRQGASRTQAAIAATKQIGVAVIGCTATLVFAFLPLMFLPGAAGDYIRSLPVAVVVTVVASLFVSLTIIPFLASRVLRENEDEHGNFFLKGLHRFIDFTYKRLLGWSIARPARTLAIAGGLFAASLALVPVIGFSLFPKAGLPQFRVTIETPEGSSLAETDKATRFVENELATRPEIKSYMTNLGKGNPFVYYNVPTRNEKSNVAEILAEVHKYRPARTPKFYDELRGIFASYPNAKIELKEFENGPPIDAPIAVRLVGENLETLKKLAGDVEGIFKSTPGTLYVNNPVKISKTDIKVALDHDKAGLFGVPVAEVQRTVRMSLAGISAGKYREEDGDEYDINLTLPRNGKTEITALDHIYVASLTGAQIPLRQLAALEFKASPTRIDHYNKERAVTMTAFVKTGYNTDRVTKEILAKLDAVKFPAGYRYIPAGEIESRQESFGGLGTAILIAIFGVLATLVLEFRGFKSTLIVLSVVPLGMVGGLTMLLLTGNSLSFVAIIGFIALVGIEVKTSILLVDFTNQLREEGLSIDEAVQKAGEIRFVPVLLTTMTAIGGLLPIALGGSALYSPLAWVVIGGLISSTLLARLVTPVMYKLLPPARAFEPEVNMAIQK